MKHNDGQFKARARLHASIALTMYATIVEMTGNTRVFLVSRKRRSCGGVQILQISVGHTFKYCRVSLEEATRTTAISQNK